MSIELSLSKSSTESSNQPKFPPSPETPRRTCIVNIDEDEDDKLSDITERCYSYGHDTFPASLDTLGVQAGLSPSPPSPPSAPPSEPNFLIKYFRKFKGVKGKRKPRYQVQIIFREAVASFIGALLGIFAVSFLHFEFLQKSDSNELFLLVASFGATAVLVYAIPEAAVSQPYNVLVGQVVSAFVGMGIAKGLGHSHWISSSLSVSVAIFVQVILHALHPPGAASALIPCLSPQIVSQVGFLYPLLPIGTGTVIMLIVAILINNVWSFRTYPQYWW